MKGVSIIDSDESDDNDDDSDGKWYIIDETKTLP